MHYICLFSHVLLQESLMPCQYDPHTYTHSGKWIERKIITPNISYLKALRPVRGCGCPDKSCGALAKARAVPTAMLLHLKGLWGVSAREEWTALKSWEREKAKGTGLRSACSILVSHSWSKSWHGFTNRAGEGKSSFFCSWVDCPCKGG